jgi:hypothetical protein
MHLSKDAFGKMKAYLDAIDPDRLDFLEYEEPNIMFGYRIGPAGIIDYISQFTESGNALAYLGDDVGNPPSVAYKDWYITLPGAMDEDQDTIKMDRDTWEKIEAILIKNMEDQKCLTRN